MYSSPLFLPLFLLMLLLFCNMNSDKLARAIANPITRPFPLDYILFSSFFLKTSIAEETLLIVSRTRAAFATATMTFPSGNRGYACIETRNSFRVSLFAIKLTQAESRLR